MLHALWVSSEARKLGYSGYQNGTLAQLAYLELNYQRAELLMRQGSQEMFPLCHFVSAIICAQPGMKTKPLRSGTVFSRCPHVLRTVSSGGDKAQLQPQGWCSVGGGSPQGQLPMPDTKAAETAFQAVTLQR
jgi:adenylate cyclase